MQVYGVSRFHFKYFEIKLLKFRVGFGLIISALKRMLTARRCMSERNNFLSFTNHIVELKKYCLKGSENCKISDVGFDCSMFFRLSLHA